MGLQRIGENLVTKHQQQMGRITYRKTQQWPQNFSIGGQLGWKKDITGPKFKQAHFDLHNSFGWDGPHSTTSVQGMLFL